MQWNGHKIQVVSLGVGDTPNLDLDALHAIKSAELIIGAEHHLETVDSLLGRSNSIDESSHIQKVLFPSPFNELAQLIEQNQKKTITILASGDALFYGVGVWLVKNIGREHLVFHPNVSSLQVAFHRIGLPWQNALIHSLHGRPLNSLNSRLQNGVTLGLFTDENSNPVAIAEQLNVQGFGESEIWVCESLGTDEEHVTNFNAYELITNELNSGELTQKSFSPLNVCIVKCIGQNDCRNGVSGIADECFETGAAAGKGMITKREVRLSILSLMECHPNDVAWDIGAGCGSVSIEWALQNKTGIIYAVENNQQRMDYLKINNQKFGTELNLKTVSGLAPDCCNDLPVPDVVFVGGNGGNLSALLEFSYLSLQQGGRLVASAVMPDSIQALHEFANKHQQQKGELIQIQVSKTNFLSEVDNLNELKPITLLKVVKN